MSHALLETIKDADDKYEEQTSGKQILFYGAGNCCRQILLYFDEIGLRYPSSIWDRAARKGQRLFGIPVLTPDFASLNGCDDTVCIITIESKSISSAVKAELKKNGFTNIIENQEIMRTLSRRLWMKLEEQLKIEDQKE